MHDTSVFALILLDVKLLQSLSFFGFKPIRIEKLGNLCGFKEFGFLSNKMDLTATRTW